MDCESAPYLHCTAEFAQLTRLVAADVRSTDRCAVNPAGERSGTGPWLGRGSALSGSAVLLLHGTSGGVGRLQPALICRRRAPDCSKGSGWGDTEAPCRRDNLRTPGCDARQGYREPWPTLRLMSRPRRSHVRMDVRKQLEVPDVTRSHDGEVSAIDRGDRGDSESLGDGDHHRIDCSKREIAVDGDQFCASSVVGKLERLHPELSARDRLQESSFEVD